MSELELVIRGGTVIDGSGIEPFEADVAVADGRIVEVGRVSRAGRDEIDARGLCVTPGFVDMHTHYDGQVTWEHRLVPSSSHGVTTGGDGQLRRRLRAVPAGPARGADSPHGGRRGHPPPRPGRRAPTGRCAST